MVYGFRHLMTKTARAPETQRKLIAHMTTIGNPHPLLSSSMSLDASKYKDVKTSRGLSYHYYYSPAQSGNPTLVFLHGFPSTSQDWRRIAPFFESHGYGVVVPDLLGYGGTSKPLNVQDFRASSMANDIIDVLDAENLAQVIVVGHDWYEFPPAFDRMGTDLV